MGVIPQSQSTTVFWSDYKSQGKNRSSSNTLDFLQAARICFSEEGSNALKSTSICGSVVTCPAIKRKVETQLIPRYQKSVSCTQKCMFTYSFIFYSLRLCSRSFQNIFNGSSKSFCNILHLYKNAFTFSLGVFYGVVCSEMSLVIINLFVSPISLFNNMYKYILTLNYNKFQF